MMWPVCQTPPRVVTHHSWVLKPSRTTSQNRSVSRLTPSRPSSIQHRPRVPAASEALIPDSHWSSTTGSKTSASGMNRIAGNGANGT